MTQTTYLLAAMAAFVALPARAAPEQVESHAAAGTPSVAAEPDWRFAGAAYVYYVPESPVYVQPTFRVDHHVLHLEARYNYEDVFTGSAWAGVNAAGGDTVWWELTLMFGGVFGHTNGLAPGFEGAVGWWHFELYSEGEYVLDFASAADDFFFSWSELTFAPVPWFRFGLLTERTRIFSSGRVLERGLLAGFSWGPAELTLHVLNPDDSKPAFIVALSASFGH
jgi:hypothetical protein